MIISTTDALTGYVITDYLGLVSGRQGIGDNCFYQDKQKYLDIYSGTLAKAQSMMEAQATLIGADAIVGVHVDVETFSGVAVFCIFGTAVKVERS